MLTSTHASQTYQFCLSMLLYQITNNSHHR